MRRIARLEVDFTKPPLESVLPCPVTTQASMLGWSTDEVRAVNRRLGCYDNIPMLCQGSDCYWSRQCPTGPEFAWRGMRCPLEIVEAYRQFYSYVVELDVRPEDHADLKLVEDLVRIDLELQRIDQHLSLAGMMLDVKQAIGGPRGEIVTNKAAHPLIAVQSAKRRDRNAIYQQLMVSRESKLKVEESRGRQQQSYMDMMLRAGDLKRRAKQALEDEAAAKAETADRSDDRTITIESPFRVLD